MGSVTGRRPHLMFQGERKYCRVYRDIRKHTEQMSSTVLNVNISLLKYGDKEKRERRTITALSFCTQ